MSAVAIDAARERALAHPRDGGTLALVGGAGTGKTTTLVERARRLAGASGAGDVVLIAPSDAGVARLRARLAERLDDAPDGARIVCTSFGDAALATLRAPGGAAAEIELIDDVRASLHFERAGAELFALDWTEFVSAEIDPEITGLRTPERFSAAAFRLIRKLRASLVSPEAFRTFGLRGATEFYGRPPNFAGADLISDTEAKYRDSLRVTPAELDRQRAREVDLVKILARLYATYLETLVARGCLTPTDAVYEAALALRDDPSRRATERTARAAVLVDDAQDLTGGQLAYLAGIASDGLANVTFAGDARQSTRSFATGARGADVWKRAPVIVEFETSYRNAPPIARAATTLFDPRAGTSTDSEAGTVRGYRGDSARDEARYVATEVARLIAAGTPPGRIAIVSRGLRGASDYVAALLARDVPVDVAGAASPYDALVASDALAALWSVADPFRHDHLLRSLAAPWVGLCDASIATLCADTTQAQPLLFELPDDEPDPARSTRWDKKRDVRLGRNVTRGDVDADLSDDARERMEAFRAALARWDDARRTHDLPALARLVLDETILATTPGGARGRYERGAVGRILDDVDAFAARDPFATLHDYLTHVEIVSVAEDDLLSIEPRDVAAVRILDVEAAKGESFDAVFAVNVRSGAWPRYYTPDAFLFTSTLGMIPKENVGDAQTARTAKFTYAMTRLRFREKYMAEERRALYVAMTRATSYLSISANGRATRGKGAPELFEELRGTFQR